MDSYLKDFCKSLECDDKNAKTSIDEDLSNLGNKMQEQMISLIQDQNWERFMRVTFEFDALAELIELVVDSEYTAVFETNDPTADPNIFSDVDFYPCI